uniref:Uncharacterized protein n=1 Tax=Fundulus heteroclitus TaxID=8078 RepID=A0A3Q2QBD9_FUNHE
MPLNGPSRNSASEATLDRSKGIKIKRNFLLFSPLSLLLGAFSLSSGGSGGRGSEGGSSSVLTASSSSHRRGARAGKDSASISISSVEASSALSSGGGSAASGGSKEARGGGSSSMSYSLGGREGKKEGGLGAVTVSTVTKTGYSSGGSREGKKGSSSSAIAYSPTKERKSTTTMAAALSEVFDGRSPSRRPDVCTFTSEIRARLQSASPPARCERLLLLAGTELDDVKRLLRGNRSTSTSPTQSPNNTLPIPKKASVETKATADNQYGSVWSGDVSCGYGYNTTPNNFTTTSHLYQSGQSLKTITFMVIHSFVHYKGNQSKYKKPSSPISYETPGKDFNFVLIEKENAPVRKETERLVMAKDTGKQFVSTAHAAFSGTFSEDSLKREKQKLSSGTVEDGTDGKCKQMF